MLRSATEIMGYVLSASDGEIGLCEDFLFDDRDWTVRFMVAKTAKWLPGRKVVIAPAFLGEPDWSNGRLTVNLSRQEIEHSPPLEEHAPVSHAYEIEYWRRYSEASYSTPPPYEMGPGAFGAAPWPGVAGAMPQAIPASSTSEPDAGVQVREEHLRSMHEVKGYGIAATDQEVGQVDDFIVDDHAWVVRYLVIDTRRWLPGRKVLLAPSWVREIDWAEDRLTVDMDAEQLVNAPEFEPAEPVNRRYEIALYDYFGRPHDWQ